MYLTLFLCNKSSLKTRKTFTLFLHNAPSFLRQSTIALPQFSATAGFWLRVSKNYSPYYPSPVLPAFFLPLHIYQALAVRCHLSVFGFIISPHYHLITGGGVTERHILLRDGGEPVQSPFLLQHSCHLCNRL